MHVKFAFLIVGLVNLNMNRTITDELKHQTTTAALRIFKPTFMIQPSSTPPIDPDPEIDLSFFRRSIWT